VAGSSWEAAGWSASNKSRSLIHLKIQHRSHNSPPLDPIESKLNPVQF
jgi:hypothetical protein